MSGARRRERVGADERVRAGRRHRQRAGVAAARGSGRVVLINAGQFDAAGQVGQRVEARGPLYRDDRETCCTVSALGIGSCQN